jgi:2-haloacid dehalogenase
MIRNIFLDLDNTLLDFERGERKAISKTLIGFGITPTQEVIDRYMAINLACWRALERGEMSRDEVIYGRFERLFSELGINASKTEAQQTYQELLAGEHDFMPGAKELLDELKDSGKYRLYLATNGIPVVQYPRLSASGIDKYLDGVFISYELGYPKPKKEFFDGCAEQIPDYDPSESIIVGDNLTSDIMGGINAGIITCHYNRWGDVYDKIKPDYTINHLSELIAILDSIK